MVNTSCHKERKMRGTKWQDPIGKVPRSDLNATRQSGGRRRYAQVAQPVSVTFCVRHNFQNQLPFEWPRPPSGFTSNRGSAGVGALGFYEDIFLRHGSPAGGASCTDYPGMQVNSVGVTDGIAGTGNTSTATVTVLPPRPILTKSLAPRPERLSNFSSRCSPRGAPDLKGFSS